MRKMKNIAAAGLLAGLALTGVAGTAAAMPADQQPLRIDPSVVHPGQQVSFAFDHGPEQYGYVASTAFAGQPNPFGGDASVGHLDRDQSGVATGTVTIDPHAKPGQYEVTSRAGGGAGPAITITVVR